MAQVCGPSGGDAATAATCRSIVERERARFGAWYEMFPRSAGTDPRQQRHVRGSRSRCCPTSPRWASTCSICRRFIRSAAASARDRTTRSTRDRTTSAARGRSAAEAGGHDAVEPGLGTLEDFDRFVAEAGRASASRSRSISPIRRRPIIPTCKAASRVVPAAARRHDQVRGEPAEEISGHLPDRLRVERLGGALDGAEARHRVLDRARRQDLPRRQPAHQAVPVLGVGARRDQAAASRRHLPVRGVHPAEGDALPGQVAGSRSRTPTSPGATRRRS